MTNETPPASGEPQADAQTTPSIPSELVWIKEHVEAGDTIALVEAWQKVSEKASNRLSEVQALNQRLNAIEAAQAAAETVAAEKQGDFEQLYNASKAQIEQLQAQRRADAIERAVIVEAGKLGFNNVADAMRLINTDTLTVDESGQVSGVEVALTALAEASPYLIKQSAPPPRAPVTGNPAGSATPSNAPTESFRAFMGGGNGASPFG